MSLTPRPRITGRAHRAVIGVLAAAVDLADVVGIDPGTITIRSSTDLSAERSAVADLEILFQPHGRDAIALAAQYRLTKRCASPGTGLVTLSGIWHGVRFIVLFSEPSVASAVAA